MKSTACSVYRCVRVFICAAERSAIATAPFRDTYAYDNGYYGYDNGYYGYGGYGPRYTQTYAQRNGFVCTPGTLIRAQNGEMQICQ